MSALPGRPLRCKAGDILFRPESQCQGFVIVKSGTIRVSITGANVRELVLYRVNAGDVCLQTFACLTEGRTYTAEGVAETELDAEIIPISAYRQRLAEDEAFREMIFRAVAHRFSDFEHLVTSLALTGIEARLADALLTLADHSGDIHATHETLASEIGSAREVVSRQLAKMVSAGLVRLSRGKIQILSRVGLERISQAL
ncbi:MAG: Crp/Fnr family transcriptional regulator [Henriciella sp.]